jgi:adenine-specific DNA methylase
MFTIWNVGADKLEPMFANNNYHPKSTMVENSVFPQLGRGNWASQTQILPACIDWMGAPWDLVSSERLAGQAPHFKNALKGKSEKAYPGDPILEATRLACVSSTELTSEAEASYDLVITDPPFGGLLHYSELADFFYVWLRLVLKGKYPEYFAGEYTPKTLEAVANRARQPGKDEQTGKDNADVFYQRVLTECWKEAKRILKPGGLLAFTFHHSEDAPWVAVLESLFDAGFYLEATYPIRSDETKGTGEFGSKKIEYDIIHVCRKRTEEPKAISWAKLRREVLQDVKRIKDLLEHHEKAGLPEADLQVIRRGKALEYFSRH